MTKALKTITIFMILLGIIAIAFNFLFGEGTIALVTKEQIHGTELYWYKYDATSYIKQLEQVFTAPPQFLLDLPSRQWATQVDINNWWDVIVNNLAVMLDYVIMIINILNWPFRLGGYLCRLILSVIGTDVINPQGGLSWLVVFINTLLNLFIPYV